MAWVVIQFVEQLLKLSVAVLPKQTIEAVISFFFGGGTGLRTPDAFLTELAAAVVSPDQKPPI